jgi:hypothetical protein
MSKTNREKNKAYDQSQVDRVRPKKPAYDFAPLEAVIRQWAEARTCEQT